MSLNKYQRRYGAWALICYIFIDACLEFEYMILPLIISMYSEVSKPIQTMFHPAWLPTEWLPYILIIWFIGHVVIWIINRFR